MGGGMGLGEIVEVVGVDDEGGGHFADGGAEKL